ncbi:hypothetical protein AKJ09_08479 [Labilithrix luteola]|uniref:SGNH hydrolase-type esterase domain-containing protein n=1 Tax=Labilithrix luteola TaxID=1391654 RepID=A0A0K1Q7M2_9BACT|nr:DUF459 domain-containing protein [Labilithrix luteola]AKV01816.1 hypothetical protein AKJ09_08479 [Labilithrix luteola]
MYRAFVASAVSLAILALAGCSRGAPGGAQGEPPAPVAKEDTRPMLNVAVVEVKDASAPPVATTEPPPPAPPSLAGKTILHVGDSMVGGLGGLTKALEERFEKEGAKLVRDYKVSESIVTFDKSKKLSGLLKKHNPDIVIITLGANDSLVPFPKVMAPNVESIVKRLEGRECYWIGPPMWKPDTGIVSVIRDHASPCAFYDSSPLKLQRGDDGIHPTNQGGADWADEFWKFFRKSETERVAASEPAGPLTGH